MIGSTTFQAGASDSNAVIDSGTPTIVIGNDSYTAFMALNVVSSNC